MKNEIKYYDFNEASEFCSVPKKYLENYAKVGKELKITKVGIRNKFAEEVLENWKNNREFASVKLDRDDYINCLEFAVKSYYHYKSTSDFGTSQQRDAGKFVSNFVIGKLGEITAAKFFKRAFNIDVKLDFDLRDAVVGQDITEIAKPRKGGKVYNPLKLRIAIKTSKMKNVWLIVGQKEVEDKERSSDVYIYSRVDLYLNHFIRILKEHKALTKLGDIIPPFEDIDAEVCGYVYKRELTSSKPVKQLPSPRQDIQPSYIKRTGELHRSKEDWSKLIDQL